MNVKKKTQLKKTLEPGKVRVYNPVTGSYYILTLVCFFIFLSPLENTYSL